MKQLKKAHRLRCKLHSLRSTSVFNAPPQLFVCALHLNLFELFPENIL